MHHLILFLHVLLQTRCSGPAPQCRLLWTGVWTNLSEQPKHWGRCWPWKRDGGAKLQLSPKQGLEPLAYMLLPGENRAGAVLAFNKEWWWYFSTVNMDYLCKKKCEWPWGGELPGLESAPEWWGSVGRSQVGLSICPWRDLISWRLRMKPIAFVLSCLSILTHSPDTYSHPLDTSLQVGRSLRSPRLLYIKTYRGSKKFWQ